MEEITPDSLPANKNSRDKYTAQLKYFVECVEAGRQPVPGGKDGWTNMRIVDAAYESSRTGKVVEL